MRTFLLCLPLFLLTACGKEAASIGIIGGADGPTAIMVTGGFPWGLLIGGFAIGLIAGWIWKRKKK
ncbi:MAG: sodium ion-translocating decarboxylase subunit beta [Clostridia bacterium]|nr:sodium ion-translocating decarboxylase subunit beta [Clostridia bacterium]